MRGKIYSKTYPYTLYALFRGVKKRGKMTHREISGQRCGRVQGNFGHAQSVGFCAEQDEVQLRCIDDECAVLGASFILVEVVMILGRGMVATQNSHDGQATPPS